MEPGKSEREGKKGLVTQLKERRRRQEGGMSSTWVWLNNEAEKNT